jgi:hypothetical protein
VLGGGLWIGHLAMTWGWTAAAWFLIAPAIYGILRAWPIGRSSGFTDDVPFYSQVDL